MKIVIPDAIVTAVTGHAEANGEEKIPGGKSLTLEASIHPKLLAELRENLPEVLYDEDEIPRVEGLGWLEWLPEYEKAVVQVGLASAERKDDLTFTAADLKKIRFFARPGFLADIKFTVKVNANKAQHGELDYLLQQKVHIAIKKATQVRIEEKSEGKKDDKQPDLPGTADPPPTTDGKPITPLIPNEPAVVEG